MCPIKNTSLIILTMLCSSLAIAGGIKSPDTSKVPRPTVKVLVIQTLARDVGLDRAAEYSDLFMEQLKKIEHLEVKDPKETSREASAIPESAKEALAKAQSLIAKGKESLLNISLDDAAEAFQSARVLYRKNLAYLDDPEPLIVALMGLAEALSTMGNEEGARFSYKEVLCINPDFEPDPGQVPSKLRSLFEEVRQEVSRQLGGQLSVQVQPEGSAVMLDGLTIGKSPIIKGDIPPGLHFIMVSREGFSPLRMVVEIKGGQTAKVQEKLKPLLGLELIRKLRTSLAKDEVGKSLELAKDLDHILGLNAVICSQLTKPSQSISPVFSVAIIPTEGKPSKLAVRLPEKSAKRVLEALALQISDTLDEGSSPVAVSDRLGLDFEHSLLGIPKTLRAPTVITIPAGMDTSPGTEKYPGPIKEKPGQGVAHTGPSLWTRWWLWTGVGVIVAGGIATTLALTLDEGQKTINDPDRILIRMDTSPDR